MLSESLRADRDANGDSATNCAIARVITRLIDEDDTRERVANYLLLASGSLQRVRRWSELSTTSFARSEVCNGNFFRVTRETIDPPLRSQHEDRKNFSHDDSSDNFVSRKVCTDSNQRSVNNLRSAFLQDVVRLMIEPSSRSR